MTTDDLLHHKRLHLQGGYRARTDCVRCSAYRQQWALPIGPEMKESIASTDFKENDEDLSKPIHGQVFDVPFERLVEWRGTMKNGDILQTSVRGKRYKFTAFDHQTGQFTIEPAFQV